MRQGPAAPSARRLPCSAPPPAPSARWCAASAADIDPHRALYSLTLDRAKSGSGVLGATGAMYYEWGETCDGWTVDQRFRLRLDYAERAAVEISSTLVTWESKDGLRYRFNERRLRNGEVDEDIHGEAHLEAPARAAPPSSRSPRPRPSPSRRA